MSTQPRHLIPFITAAAALIALPATANACPAPPKFVTPSGNIWCRVPNGFDSSNGVVCEIRDHTYTPPAKPADCHLDWGDRVSLKPGSAPEVHCHGDTIFDSGMPTLAYGQTRSAGPMKCESQPAGVTCTDTGTGHFFRMSRDSLELG
ncbi:hypothetical protein H7J71_24355 [Mycolicibacterium peregrinum]|uniref:DUF6636 domain-containing protein n=1 Tax=Mycolicibacterium peregrinum TaxID=43304 RepID=UPI001054BFE6|nr:DUF6636 domain-containing protein [Mycolicibacterium peregrinum]MCV7205145.1 hypothetical protein [Mycolicibacterium peregrinum]